MTDIRATNSLWGLFVLMLAAPVVFPLDALADRDQKCVDDCRQLGYQWSFCDSKCSYNDSQPQNPGKSLTEIFATQGLAAGYMRGEQEGQRQALIQQQIENQRLQNEILKRQLNGYGAPLGSQPTAAPQHYQNAKPAEYLAQGLAAHARQNYPDALFLFRKSAELGNASAQNNVGAMYTKGQGVTQNYHEAFRCYLKAAELGSVQAHANLGAAYEMGQGVPKNYNEALAWYRKAANLGHDESKLRIAGIEKTLNQQRQTPQTNVTIEMTARSRAGNEGCEVASINNVIPPTGFNFAYEISCSDSSIRKYKCNSSDCSLVSVVPPMGFQTKRTSKWPNH